MQLTARLAPAQYTVGSAESAQIQLPYEGVAEQHAILCVEESRVVVELLVDGVRVNTHPTSECVEAAFPMSMEMAGLMMVVELREVADESAPLAPAPEPFASMKIQISISPKETEARGMDGVGSRMSKRVTPIEDGAAGGAALESGMEINRPLVSPGATLLLPPSKSKPLCLQPRSRETFCGFRSLATRSAWRE